MQQFLSKALLEERDIVMERWYKSCDLEGRFEDKYLVFGQCGVSCPATHFNWNKHLSVRPDFKETITVKHDYQNRCGPSSNFATCVLSYMLGVEVWWRWRWRWRWCWRWRWRWNWALQIITTHEMTPLHMLAMSPITFEAATQIQRIHCIKFI